MDGKCQCDHIATSIEYIQSISLELQRLLRVKRIEFAYIFFFVKKSVYFFLILLFSAFDSVAMQ